MIVAFSIGAKSVPVTNTLKNLADNIEFYTYTSIQAMIKEAMLRHLAFDRIVFSTALLKDAEGDLRELNDFIRNYSDSTEVVMIVTSKDPKTAKIFSGIFNSPMYTPVILEKATPQSLLEIVTGDITELKMKYYELDVKKDKAVVSTEKKDDVVAESKISSNKKEPKKGFFGSLMGGRKKNTQNAEVVNSVKEVEEVATNIASSATEGIVDSVIESGSNFAGFGDSKSSDAGSVNEEYVEKLPKSENTSTPFGIDDLPSEDYSFNELEDDLSIGDFGSQHSDTGFLDEDGEEELKRYAESKGIKVEEDNDDSGLHEESEKEKVESEEPEYKEEPIIAEKEEKTYVPPVKVVKYSSKIKLVTGLKGSGVSQSLVDEAVSLAEAGKKVLLVDLDVNENGILSYVDLKGFYKQKCEKGILRNKIYREDGVDIVSNGYGYELTEDEVVSFFNDRLLSRYDSILVDCPINCLYLMDINLLRKCDVIIMSGADLSDLISTSLALTNRGNLSLDVEKYIMSNCIVKAKRGEEFSSQDIDFVNKLCLFANGNWLLNI